MTTDDATTHYHASCDACGGRGLMGESNGQAFADEATAREHANGENAESYMRGFGDHHYRVTTCTGQYCLDARVQRTWGRGL